MTDLVPGKGLFTASVTVQLQNLMDLQILIARNQATPDPRFSNVTFDLQTLTVSLTLSDIIDIGG